MASSKAREDTYSSYLVKTVRRNILYCSVRKGEAVGNFLSIFEDSSGGLTRGRHDAQKIDQMSQAFEVKFLGVI